MIGNDGLRRRAWLGICMFLPSLLHAQADRYVFPVPTSRALSGTFGEMRGGSYHFGLDIRTFERTGLPVVAAADGYISRIKVSFNGYGKAIYVQHTVDSNTTVYAHVDSFLRPLQTLLEDRQRATGLFDQEFFFKIGEHPVKQGQLIAYSGNTGASQGPHLHYEVRAYNEWPLNPLAFHKSHLRDALPPVLTKIGFEPLTAQSRVEGKWLKHVLVPRRSESATFHPGVVQIEGPVGLEFVGYDRLSGSRNWNGIYRVRWWLDDSLHFECRLDRHGWEHNRTVMHYYDAPYARRYGDRFQKAYVDLNMDAPFYPLAANRGILSLADTFIHRLRLEVEDFHGNRTSFVTRVQQSAACSLLRSTGLGAATRTTPSFEQRRGYLVLHGPLALTDLDSDRAAVSVTYADNRQRRFEPTYCRAQGWITLVPLEAGALPVRAESAAWSAALTFPAGTIVAPGADVALPLSNGRLHFGPHTTFQSAFVEVATRPSGHPRVLSDIVHVGDWLIPLNQPFDLSLTLIETGRAAEFKPAQIVLAQVIGNGFERVGGELRVGNRFSGKIGTFGDFCLVADIAPPTATPLNFRSGYALNAPFLKFKLVDDIAGVHPYKISVTLDGQWVVPEYYNFQNALFVRWPGKLTPGRHIVIVSSADFAGNAREQRFTFVAR